MRYILCILSIYCALSSIAQEKKVLFVGNSLTYYNDMPQTLQKMIDEKGIKIKIEQETPPGYNLVSHAKFRENGGNAVRIDKDEAAPTVQRILSRNWDIVILQEAPIEILIPDKRYYCAEPALKYLDSIIKSKHATTIIYQNYALPKYPVKYCSQNGPHNIIFRQMAFDPQQQMVIQGDSACSDSFQNSEQEFTLLRDQYNKLAGMIHADLAEVGHYFELCKKHHPEIQLYDSADDSHPSREGSYLIACVFFHSLTKEQAHTVTYNAGIDKDTAKKLQELVDSSR